MGRRKRDSSAAHAVASARLLLSNHDGSPFSPEEAEIQASLFLAEKERRERYRELSMVNMLDGTTSASWSADGINFTPAYDVQTELRQRLQEIPADKAKQIPAPSKFPIGSPYAGWLIKEPFIKQKPSTLNDEPLFQGSLLVPPENIIAVSSGTLLFDK